MSTFGCSECEKKFLLKANLDRHISNVCKTAKILYECSETQCKFCEKKFSTFPSLRRHIKKCKDRIENERERVADEKMKIIKDRLDRLKTQNEKIRKKLDLKKNAITLNPWDDPFIPDDVIQFYKSSTKKTINSVPTLINLIHFNPAIPENHNIFLGDLRSKTIRVFNGEYWQTMDGDDIIITISNENERTLIEYAEDHNPLYMENIRRIILKKGQEEYDRVIQESVKRLLYDKNNIINTKKC
jgi:hypothetical protein